MATTLPWRFPREADRIHEEAGAFRRLSPGERLDRILDLIASGQALMQDAPKREAARRLRRRDEAEWRRAMRELFQRHGL